MRRVLVVALVALVAIALYATTAPAGQQAVTPKQLAALSKRVKALETDNKNLKDFAAAVVTCVFDKGAIATSATTSTRFIIYPFFRRPSGRRLPQDSSGLPALTAFFT